MNQSNYENYPQIPVPQDVAMQFETPSTGTATETSPSLDLGADFAPNMGGVPAAGVKQFTLLAQQVALVILGVPTGGTFNLTLDTIQLVMNETIKVPITITGIAYGASAATIQAAIREANTLFAAVTVSGTNPNMTIGIPSTLGIKQIWANSSALTGGTSPTVLVFPAVNTTFASTATSGTGTFSLACLNGATFTTGPISYSASASALTAAIQALGTPLANVQASGSMTNGGTLLLQTPASLGATVTASLTGLSSPINTGQAYFIQLQESDDNINWSGCSNVQPVNGIGEFACFGEIQKEYISLLTIATGANASFTGQSWLNRNVSK